MSCNKVSYPSEHAARENCKSMGNRFRVYPCPEPGHGYHVTKQVGEAGGNNGKDGDFIRRKNAKRRRFRHGYEE